MSDKLYNVLWIDDQCKIFEDFYVLARKEGINIDAFEFGHEGIMALKSAPTKYDGIILDVRCLYDSRNEVDSDENFFKTHRELLDFFHKEGQIPTFIFTGQKDYDENALFDNYLKGLGINKLYHKSNREERKQLFDDIKKAAVDKNATLIRHKYLDYVGELPSDIVEELIKIISFVEEGKTDDTSVFNQIRCVLDWLMKELHAYGLLPKECIATKLNENSRFLCNKDLEKYVPVHIQRSIHSCVEICQNGSHRISFFEIVKNNQAPFVIRSTVFELLNSLTWYCSLPHDKDSIDAMKAYISKISLEDVPGKKLPSEKTYTKAHPGKIVKKTPGAKPSKAIIREKIEGALEKDENNLYHCGDYLISDEAVKKLALKVGDKVCIVGYIKNTTTDPQKAKYTYYVKLLE